jgi:hypothetical protein
LRKAVQGEESSERLEKEAGRGDNDERNEKDVSEFKEVW